MSIAYAGSVGFFGSGQRSNKPKALLAEAPSAAAAYSLRNISGNPNDNVVRVRRDGDNLERNFNASELTAELEDWVNGKQETTLPADVASAAAAYSLRKVRSAYSGNALRIRRTSDNVEVDVAFDSNDKVSLDSAITNTSEQQTLTLETSWSIVAGSATSTTLTPLASLNVSGTSSGFIVGVGIIDTIVPVGKSVNVSSFVNSLSGSWEIYLVDSGGTQVSATESITSTGNLSKSLTVITGQPASIYIKSTSTNSSIALGFFFGAGYSVGNTGNASLAGFIDGADATVVTWYDQSGNSEDASQSTMSDQPLFAESGTLKDHLLFDGSSDFLATSSSILSGEQFMVSSVQSLTSTSGSSGGIWAQYTAGTTGRTILIADRSANDYELFSQGTNSIILNSPTVDTNNKVLTIASDGTNAEMFRDGSSADTDLSVNVSIQDIAFSIGGTTDGAFFYDGEIREIVVFNADESSNRFKIESNINNYYDISAFDDTRDGFVHTWFDQSGSGNNATQSTQDADQPKIVSAGTYLGELDFDGDSQFLDMPAITAKSIFALMSAKTAETGTQRLIPIVGNEVTTGRSYIFIPNNESPFNGYAISLDGAVADSGSWYLNGTFKASGGNLGTFGDIVSEQTMLQTIIYTTAGDPATTVNSICRVSGVEIGDATFKELILFSSDQTDNRSAIETNINDHYSIF